MQPENYKPQNILSHSAPPSRPKERRFIKVEKEYKSANYCSFNLHALPKFKHFRATTHYFSNPASAGRRQKRVLPIDRAPIADQTSAQHATLTPHCLAPPGMSKEKFHLTGSLKLKSSSRVLGVARMWRSWFFVIDMEDHMLKYFKNQTQASKGHKPQETISLSYIDRISSSMEGKKDQTRRLRIHFKRKRNPLHLKVRISLTQTTLEDIIT
eukprot:1362600-Amorphochlora_amoeboformis.AAC.1